MPDAEHLIAYHIVTSGTCVGGLIGEAAIELLPGDVIVFPHGDPHYLSSAPSVPPTLRGVIPVRYPETYQLGDGSRIDGTFICGFLGCDRRPFNPLLASLPRQIHARGLREGALAAFAGRIVEESGRETAGEVTVLTRLAELMFIDVLRDHVANLPPGRSGWLAGLADPVVAGALERLHADPSHAWTLEELAQAVAISRSRLAARFVKLVGQPPMQYLAAWRMQLAAGLLAQNSAKISAVAAAVGYDSEASFSRAFKKATGKSPGAWRAASACRASIPTAMAGD
jgi:AraC-like DNA-binding protein